MALEDYDVVGAVLAAADRVQKIDTVFENVSFPRHSRVETILMEARAQAVDQILTLEERLISGPTQLERLAAERREPRKTARRRL
jgi:hypothetical protein